MLPFKQRLHDGQPLLGVILTLPDPAVAEIFARIGFDWLWIDAEHSPLDPSEVQRLVQAAGACPCLVRVPGLDEAWVKKTLDTGVDGIIFPLVNTPQDAAEAVALCKYPPQGRRSVGIGRAQGYGPGFAGYIASANARTCVVVQIEHIRAVEVVDEIIATPGVDAALVGPFDLSNSMGLPGRVDAPEVQAAIERVRQACAAAGVPVGIFSASAAGGRRFIEQGFAFVGAGVDVMLLAEAAAGVVRTIRGDRPG